MLSFQCDRGEKEMYRKTAEDLLEFIKKSPTAYQAVETMSDRFIKEGFTRLYEEERWKLIPGGRYFVTRNSSAIIAFSIPEKKQKAFTSLRATAILRPLRLRKIRR